MTATSLNALRAQASQRETGQRESGQREAGQREADEKMDQIRDLLVGDLVRRTDARLAQMEARMVELEAGIGSRLTALHARLDALSGEMGANRRATFEELARGVAELGDRIRKISRE